MKRLKVLIAGSAALAIGIGEPLAADTASAGSGAWVFSIDSPPTGGLAIFDGNYGGPPGASQEKFAVCDQDVDGHIAWGRIRTPSGWEPWVVDSSEASPNGSCTEVIYDLAETMPIEVQICLRNKWNNVWEYCASGIATA